MNNDMKEILDDLRTYKDRYEYFLFNNLSFSDRDYKAKVLLDYITNLQEKYNEYKNLYFSEHKVKEDYKSRNEKANILLDKMLERAYIDGEYIMYDYSTSELLEVKQALQGDDNNE